MSRKRREAQKTKPKPKVGIPSTFRPKRQDGDKVEKLEALQSSHARVAEARRGAAFGDPELAVLDELTPLQRQVQETGVFFAKLLENDFGIDAAVKALVAFRRCYVVAYRYLQEKCSQFPNAPELLQDYVIQFAMHEAGKPFDEQELMQALIDEVVVWTGSVVDEHVKADAEAMKEEVRQRIEERKKRPVPIGFRHSPCEAEPLLQRGTTLTLVGWRPAVRWLIRKAIKTAEESGNVLVWFGDKIDAKSSSVRVAAVAREDWLDCCASKTKLATVMGEQVLDKVGEVMVDMVAVDDLSACLVRTLVGRPPAAVAGDAHRVFRKWCDPAAAALLAGIPLPEKGMPDVTTPDFEQLKAFTTLRPVRVDEEAEGLEPGKLRIVVGWEAASFDVDKAELDELDRTIVVSKSTIIV